MRELAVIQDGAVLVSGGIIAAAGRSGEIARLAGKDVIRIDASGKVVAPGFVDAHTHPVFGGTRENEYELRASGVTYKEIAERGGGILATVRKTRAASQEALFETGRRHAYRFLEHGTTTIEAKSGYGLTTADEIKLLETIRRLDLETPLTLVPTFLGAHEIPEEFRGEARDRYLRLIKDEMLPRVASTGLARYCDVFCESHVFSAPESREILTRARELGLGLRIHADQLSASGGAHLAAELGADTADHLEWTDHDSVESLERAGVTAVLLPGAVFNLGMSRYPPARSLIDSGVPVVVATDFNPGSSPTVSMQMILSIACAQMRMTPAESFTAATINAACSLGLGEKLGSLEQGKQADIVIFDCEDYRQVPYFFGMNHVTTVIKAGEVVIGPGNPGSIFRMTGKATLL
jgi:imidazolonepropionase